LLLIIVGNGFFKPNISTLLGNLYSAPEFKENKDSGFNIFYMGINIGAFICNFFAAYLRNNFGWGSAFMAAGIGMIIGVIIFISGNKHYLSGDVRKPTQKEDMSLGRIFSIVLLPAFIAGYIGWILPDNIFGSDSTDAFIFGALPVSLFYVSLWVRASKEDKRPIASLLAIMGVVIVFWAIFKQNGTALTTWAESYTNREIPASMVAPAKTLGMVQEVSYTKDSLKLTDHQFRLQKNEEGKAITTFNYPDYYKNIPAQELPAEGETKTLISTEIFQSVNPFFVVLLTPLVVGFFAFLRRKKKEPSTPTKIFWGLFITALSTLVMIAATIYCHQGAEKSSVWWLIGAYGVITIGELCLSPIGLSLVSKLSPPRLSALMMGGWFLSTSIGNKLSGVMASMWDTYQVKSWFFVVNLIVALAASIAILFMLKWLNRIMKEHGLQ
jgi:POT family proton-dependent oligopeptide transporter